MSSFFGVIDRYSIKNQAKTMKVCRPLFETFGINSFFYQIISNNTNYGLIGTHNDYYQEYFDQKLYLHNPFLMQLSQLQSGFYLVDSIKNPEFQNDLNKLGAKYNTKASCMWVQQRGSICCQAGFGYPIQNRDKESLLVNQKRLLDRFLRYFEQEMYSVVNEIYCETNQLLSSQPLRHSMCKGHQLPFIDMGDDVKTKFVNKLKTSNHYPLLSQRQAECLKFHVKGNTVPQIAAALQLSKRTVEHYFESIKIKFNCSKKSELNAILSQARELGLYDEIFR